MKVALIVLASVLLGLAVVSYPAYYLYTERVAKITEVQAFVDESHGVFQIKKIQWSKRHRWHFEVEGINGKRMLAFVPPLLPEDPPVPGQWWTAERNGVWLVLTAKVGAPKKALVFAN